MLKHTHKNICRCLCIVHGTVMIFKQNIQVLCKRIKLIIRQIRIQTSCKRHCVHIGKFKVRSGSFCLFFHKSHVKFGIVRHKHTAGAKFFKSVQLFLDSRSVLYHVIRYSRKLDYIFGNRHLRIYKR